MDALVRLLVLLCLLHLTVGCTTRGSRGDDDTGDDDDSGDDDDDDDDDDTTPVDDDDTTPPGDDDDSTLVEGSSTITGAFIIQYFTDTTAQSPYCQQAYEFSGASETRANVLGNSFQNATAKIDVTSLTDVTASTAHPAVVTRCTANMLASDGDLGAILSGVTTVPDDSGNPVGGDFLDRIGLIDAGTGVAGNRVVTLDGTTYATLRDDYASAGLTFTHVGYYNQLDGGWMVSDSLGIPGASSAGSPGTQNWPFWTIGTQAGTTDGRFIGQYFLNGVWSLGFNGAGIQYQLATFNGDFVGQ